MDCHSENSAIKMKDSTTFSNDESSDKTKSDSPQSLRMEQDEMHVRKLQKSSQRGSIQLIMGPMFAGKSTELLRRVNRHEISGKRILSVKFNMDNRYSEECISTHDK